MGNRKTSKGIWHLVLSLALLLGLWIGTDFAWRSFSASRERLKSELMGIPVYDEALERGILQKQLNISDAALARNYADYQILEKQVNEAVIREVEAKYNNRAYMEEFAARQRRLQPAKLGDAISFEIRTAEDSPPITINGAYEGMVGQDIFVGGRNIPASRVLPKYHYLFSKNASINACADLSRTFKQEYQERRDKFMSECYAELMKERCLKEGYVSDGGGGWITPPRLLARELERRKNEVAAERKELLSGIRDRHRFFKYLRFDVVVEDGSH